MSQAIKNGLFHLLKVVTEDGAAESRAIAKELTSIATRYYAGDKQYTQHFVNYHKGRYAIAEEIASRPPAKEATSSRFKNEWGTGLGKTPNGGPSLTPAPPVAVNESAAPDAHNEDLALIDPAELVGLGPQKLLEIFGSTKKMKQYSKELAWPIDRRLGAANFAESFADYVADHFGDTVIDEEE